ncbi:hypothetical protein ABVT39_012766 [Epinephelus coioides]
MKVQLVLPVVIMTSVALMGVMKLRQKEQDKEDRRKRFQDIKLRVTYDVLQEYEGEKAQQQNLLEKTRSEEKALSEEVIKLQTRADKAKGDVDVCTGDQKSARDELAAFEADLSHLQADNDKEKTSWTAEVETLKQQLAAPSGVCGFLKAGAPEEVSKLCGKEVAAEAPKQEEPKAEAPKQEEPKAEAPKQEEPKAEAPKPEEPKAEAPKQEEAKAEALKKEEAKAEAPKQEEAKAEAPKQEEAKAEAPKKEEAKAEAPKQEEAKAEAPKKEEAKAEAPKKEEAKAEAPKKR